MLELAGQPPVLDSQLAARLREVATAPDGPDLLVAFPNRSDELVVWDRVIAADRPADDRPALVRLTGELGTIRAWAATLHRLPDYAPDPPIWPWGDGEIVTPEGFAARERALLWWVEARLRRTSNAPWPRVLRPWPRHAWVVIHRAPLTDAERGAFAKIVGESFPT